MEIDLLYFEGCPSRQEGLENLKTALIREAIQAEINLVRVNDNAGAMRLQFLGSPSFRVNAIELWQEQREHYNLSCGCIRHPQN
jgi:hypothetical protein